MTRLLSCPRSRAVSLAQKLAPTLLTLLYVPLSLSLSGFRTDVHVFSLKSHDIHVFNLKTQKRNTVLEKRTPIYRFLASITDIHPIQMKTSAGLTWVKPEAIFFVSRINPLQLYDAEQVC